MLGFLRLSSLGLETNRKGSVSDVAHQAELDEETIGLRMLGIPVRLQVEHCSMIKPCCY